MCYKPFVTWLSMAVLVVSHHLHSAELVYQNVNAKAYENSLIRSGKLTFQNIVSLSFKSQGFLSQLNVDNGDVFHQGDVLASLDTEELIAHKNASYASLLQAKREVERTEKLRKQNLSSNQALDIALSNVENARAAHQVAQYHLTKSQIIAPFNGVVLMQSAELGELQSPGKEALKIAAIENNTIVRIAVTSQELEHISLGQRVTALLNNKQAFDGYVARIPAITLNKANLFEIDIALPAFTFKKNKVVVGQLAEVILTSEGKGLAYQVDIAALNGVDKQGQAIMMVKPSQGMMPEKKHFTIYKITNHHIYLQATEPEMTFVTQGWQHPLKKVD